jgi:DNA-binding MarR family transcriptional regulator
MAKELKKSIGFRISNLANLLNSTINKKILQYDIAIEQRAIMESIMFNGEIKQNDLTGLLAKDKTTISRTLKTLENKNYIVKEKIDKKTYVIKLSEKGLEVMKNSEDTVAQFRKKISSEFTKEEEENLYSYLSRIEKVIK